MGLVGDTPTGTRGAPLAPQQHSYESKQHKRKCAWFGDVGKHGCARFGRVGKRDCDAQIVGDGLRPEGVTEEGIVASLEAVRRSLRRKRINIGQRVAGVEDAKIYIGRNGTNVAGSDEVTHE